VKRLLITGAAGAIGRSLRAGFAGITYNIFEAARRAGVRRVVLASSSRVTGLYPQTVRVGPESPVRPDGHYAVSKVFGEALGRLYADRHGLEVVCLRIGTFLEQPTDVRHLSTWLSPRDCIQLIRRCLEAKELDFMVVYGVSANTRRWCSVDGWGRLGYTPRDDAEEFASNVRRPSATIGPGSPAAGGWSS
jgi:uronate dehydrogenase